MAEARSWAGWDWSTGDGPCGQPACSAEEQALGLGEGVPSEGQGVWRTWEGAPSRGVNHLSAHILKSPHQGGTSKVLVSRQSSSEEKGVGSHGRWHLWPPGALCHFRGACGPRIRAENRPHSSLCAKPWGWLDLGRRARSTQQHTRVPCTPGKASSPKQRVKSIRQAAAKERGAQEMTEAQR